VIDANLMGYVSGLPSGWIDKRETLCISAQGMIMNTTVSLCWLVISSQW